MYNARCDRCGKTYQVPMAETVYRCKECPGSVRVEAHSKVTAGAEVSPETEVDDPLPNSPQVRERRERMARSSRSTTGLWVLLCALVVFGGVVAGVLYFGRPASFEDREARFREAWNGSDLATAVTFFPQEKRESTERSLRRAFEARNWPAGDLPSLGTAEVQTMNESYSILTYSIASGPLRAHWQKPARNWELRVIELPPRPGRAKDDSRTEPLEESLSEDESGIAEMLAEGEVTDSDALRRGADPDVPEPTLDEVIAGRAQRHEYTIVWEDDSEASTELAVGPQSIFFDWSVPSQAAVTVTSSSSGKEFETRFRLELFSGEKSAERLLKIHDFAFDSVAEDEAAKVEEVLLRWMLLAPDALISDGGEFLRLTSSDPMPEFRKELEAMAGESVSASRGLDGLKTPGVGKALEDSTVMLWTNWVGAYLGLSLDEGQVITVSEDDYELAPGIFARMETRIERHDHGEAASIDLSVQETYTGPGVGQFLADELTAAVVGNGWPRLEADLEAALENMKLVQRRRVTLDPATARPTKVVIDDRADLDL